jgi:hypothetical protein
VRRGAVAFTAALIVLGALVVLLPSLLRDRPRVDATPSPPPLSSVALVNVPGAQRACLRNVVLDRGSQLARFTVGTYGRPGPALAVTAAGRRYRVPAGFPDNAHLTVALAPPATPTATSFCITNTGRRTIALYGSDELRTRSRVEVTVGGKPVGADVTLTLDRRTSASVLDQLGAVVERTTRWRPGVGEPVVWALILLVLIAVPGGVLWAFSRALAEDAAQPGGELGSGEVRDRVAR